MTESRRNTSAERVVRWAAMAPLVCAVHCLAAPALVVVLPSVLVTTRAEWGLLAATAAMALGMLAYATRQHRRAAPWTIAAAGLALWALSLSGWFAPVPEPATTLVGSTVVAAALFWNSRLLHRVTCSSCACPGCARRNEAAGERVTARRYRESWTPTR